MIEPIRIADETFALPMTFPVPGLGVLNVTPLVIRAEEPVLVETGPPVFRQEYLDAAFSLVDPDDVQWIFLSHDDRDHSGNVIQALERCPKAKLVTTFVGVGRMAEEWRLPLDRVLLVNDGETFSAGDRTLAAIRPPFYDAPQTRGLWDSRTGVYYAADCFGALIPTPADQMADVPEDAWQAGFDTFNRINHPWHEVCDPVKVAAQVDRVRRLAPKVIASYHGPVAYHRSDQLCDALCAVASMEPLPAPTQADLEAMMAAATAQGPTPVG